MHDNRRQVEERVERVLRERIRPAVYAATVPMDVEAWHVPDEPVPVQDALAASYEPFAVGTENFAESDQIGRFSAHTYGGGLRYRLTAGARLSF